MTSDQDNGTHTGSYKAERCSDINRRLASLSPIRPGHPSIAGVSSESRVDSVLRQGLMYPVTLRPRRMRSWLDDTLVLDSFGHLVDRFQPTTEGA